MSEVADLLDPVATETMRRSLQGETGLEKYRECLDPETLASLAIVGGHPTELQDLAAAIMHPAARAQLDAYRLIDREDTGERITWRLTQEGRRLARTLAAAATESRSDEQRRQSEEALRKLIEEGNADLEDGS